MSNTKIIDNTEFVIEMHNKNFKEILILKKRIDKISAIILKKYQPEEIEKALFKSLNNC